MKREELWRLSRRELADLLANGHPVAPQELAGYEYAGVSLNLPAWVERLTWKKFFKVIGRVDAEGNVRGFNMRAEQNALHEPWKRALRRGRPVIYGHFAVRADADGRVVLDYGAGEQRGHVLSPFSLVRDPLVSVQQGHPELLLGCSKLAVGARLVPTPSYFTLERLGAVP